MARLDAEMALAAAAALLLHGDAVQVLPGALRPGCPRTPCPS
jgi:hypothetical protein